MKRLILIGCALLALSAGAVETDFLFRDGLVLSAKNAFSLTGTAKPGAEVKVSLNGRSYTAKAGADGRFSVPVAAQGVVKTPFDITVGDGTDEKVVRNCLSGLLILAAGQSNMEVPVKEALNPEEEAAAANHPLIREFKVEHDFNFVPQTTMKGEWTAVSPTTAPEIGAIGYYTARRLQKELGGIPVGIVNNSYSGTSIQPWLPLEILREKYKGSLGSYDKFSPLGRDGVIKRREELGRSFLHQDAKNEGEEKGWHKGAQADWVDVKMPNWLDYLVYGEDSDGAFWVAREFDLDPAFAAKDLEFRATAIDDYDVTYLNGVRIGATGEETPDPYNKPRAYRIPKGLAKPGKNVISIRIFDTAHAGGIPPEGKVCLACGEEEFSLAGQWKTKAEKILKSKSWPADYLPLVKIYHAGSVLYNAMFVPMKGTKVDAILWYQGESNAGSLTYGDMFKDLIVRWRKDLASEEAPFVFMQLAAFQGRPKDAADTGSWPITRAEQEKALELPNVRMVPTIDIGDEHRIHPLNKQEVGRRTALVLLQDFFAKGKFKGTVDYPAVTKIVREGNALVVEFKGAKGLRTVDGRVPQGFSVVGPADPKTRKQPAAWAKARIDGEKVVVEIPPEIAEPVLLRYAWHMNPDINTVNALGFPMLPFERRVCRDVYLLIGQSNMAGRGELAPTNRMSTTGIVKFDRKGRWVEAVEPIHFDKSVAGAGLAASFAVEMERTSGGHEIGLVPCAVGGTSLCRWMPGGDLHSNALVRCRAALAEGGVLKGILWHQGENDAENPKDTATYGERLAEMVKAFRAELNAPDVPFVAGELLTDKNRLGGHDFDAVSAATRKVMSELPRCAFVSANGLTLKSDRIHFDTPSQRAFGQRYASEMKKLLDK